MPGSKSRSVNKESKMFSIFYTEPRTTKGQLPGKRTGERYMGVRWMVRGIKTPQELFKALKEVKELGGRGIDAYANGAPLDTKALFAPTPRLVHELARSMNPAWIENLSGEVLNND
jgi:hypothetical protein